MTFVRRWWNRLFNKPPVVPKLTDTPVRTEQVTCLLFKGRKVFRFHLLMEVFNRYGMEVVWFRGAYRQLKRTHHGYRVMIH